MEQEIISLIRNIFKFIGALIGLAGLGILAGVFLGTMGKVFMWMIS